MVLCAAQIHWTCSKVPWQISGDLFRFQISRTKENVHVSGGFGARGAILRSHVLCQFQDGDTGTNNGRPVREASRTGNGLGGSAVRAPTSAVGGGGLSRGPQSISFSSGTVDEPQGSQLYQHDPALRHQLRSSRKRREKQRTRNNRRRRRSALEGSGRAGHHAGGTRANPGAFWNRPERNRTIQKCEQKHRGSTPGHKNTDLDNKQLQLKLGERRNVAKTQITFEWSK